MDEEKSESVQNKWLIICVLMLLMIFTGMVYALPGPFYPAEAESKGLTQTQYGLVLGSYDLGVAIFSIPVGTFTEWVGPSRVLFTGIILLGSTTTLFGCLMFIQKAKVFLALSFIIRLFESFGQLFIQPTVMAILPVMYSKIATTMVGYLVTAFGFGMIVGPFLGGVLYDAKDFFLPFVVVGCCFFALFIPSVFLIPINVQTKSEEDPSVATVKWSQILKVPKVWIAAFFAIFMMTCFFGFLQSTLEPHLRAFDFSATATGSIFLLNGLGFALAGPAWGFLCDKGYSPLLQLIFATWICCFGLGMIGPIPGVSDEPKLYLVIIGTLLCGLGTAGVSVPSLRQMLNACEEKNIPSTFSFKTKVNALWLGTFSLGGFAGPSFGGFLSSTVGFRMATLICIGICLTYTLTVIPVAIAEILSKRKSKSIESTNM